jgi:transcriptional regulator with XRE-family HTH domain
MPKPTPSAIGLLIRQRREKARMSRAALARMAHISESTIKNIETGRNEPMRTTLEELAKALEMPELVRPQAAIVSLLEATGPEALAMLLKQYSASALVQALRLAGLDLWALFSTLFPVSAALAQTMTRLDVAAMAAEQRGDHP